MNRVEGPFDLTPLQRKYLRNLLEYCRTPPTLARIYRKVMPSYIPLVFFTAFIAYLCFFTERFETAWLLGGMILGMLARDLGNFRQTVRLWPASEAVMDRAKLAMLTEQPLDDSETW